MAATLSFPEFAIAKTHHRMRVADHQNMTTIRFNLREILWEQQKIVGIWRSLNKNDKNPVARTVLGRIISISFPNS